MPTIEYKRLWCKKCKDWELFEVSWGSDKTLKCKECGTVHEPAKLSEIPSEKIIEQRDRYNKSQSDSMNKMLGRMMMSPEESNLREMMHMFSSPGSSHDVEIIEADAGQIELNRIEREKRQEAAIKRAAEKEEARIELSKYKNIQRNDLCPCGSGKKYKKCHLLDNNLLSEKYNLRYA